MKYDELNDFNEDRRKKGTRTKKKFKSNEKFERNFSDSKKKNKPHRGSRDGF